MGPSFAATAFLKDHPDADYIKVILFGSLSKTGKDLSHLYRETSEGGLAKLYNR